MKPQRQIGRRKVMLAVIFILAVITTVMVILVYSTRPTTDMQSAVVQANQLIASAGGPAKVSAEANQIFGRFGTTNQKFLSPVDLKDYPAIAGLGRRVVIYPDSPAWISIRVGTHLNGFFIVIADTNSPEKYPRSSNTLELVDSQIFVHR